MNTIRLSLLILLLITIVSTGHSRSVLTVSERQDSIKVEKHDLKLNNGFLLELMWRRKNDIINNGLLNDYKYLLDETNNKLDIKNSEIEKQKQIAEANLPSWYDHFWVGSVVASVIFVTLILVVK